jgi:hypothetical protein
VSDWTYLGHSLAIKTDHDAPKLLIAVSDIEKDLLHDSRKPRMPYSNINDRCTLWVIFGPLVASAVCEKKTKVIVRINKTEITSRCRVAMVYDYDERAMEGWWGL